MNAGDEVLYGPLRRKFRVLAFFTLGKNRVVLLQGASNPELVILVPIKELAQPSIFLHGNSRNKAPLPV